MPAEAAEEALQLRTKVVVLQQELERHQGQSQALSQQVQVGERPRLRGFVRGRAGWLVICWIYPLHHIAWASLSFPTHVNPDLSISSCSS